MNMETVANIGVARGAQRAMLTQMFSISSNFVV